MKLIKQITNENGAVKVYRVPRYNEYQVKLYHTVTAPDMAGPDTFSDKLIEYVPARYHTESEADAIDTMLAMSQEIYKQQPAQPVRYNEMRNFIIYEVEKQYLERNAYCEMKSGADFVSGAMAAMLALGQQLYNMDPDNGAIMPPRWVFGCMRGDLTKSIKEAQKPEKKIVYTPDGPRMKEERE